MNCHTRNAKIRSPRLPIAAPAASTLAASLPRAVALSPCSCFFSFSCFSISVALAGKIAGNARNKPPMPGPYFLAISPAMAVMRPPKKNRTASSCQLVCRRTEGSALTCMLFQPHRPETEGHAKPNRHGTYGDPERLGFVAHQNPTHERGIGKKCDGTNYHRASFGRRVGSALLRNSKPNCRERHRGSRAEQAGETFWFKQIADKREGRNDQATDEEPNKNLAHRLPDFTSFLA